MDLNAVAAGLGLTFERGKKALEREAAQAARETTGLAPAELRAASTRARREARETAKAHVEWRPPSVPLRKGLRWPTEQFEGSPEYRKRGGIVRHLARVWKPLITAGVIDMALLRDFYPSTAGGIDRFKHNKGRERRPLPDDLDIPLLKAGSGRRRNPAAAAQFSP